MKKTILYVSLSLILLYFVSLFAYASYNYYKMRNEAAPIIELKK